ncbi:hypothetical protein CAEBREN_05954 [Caenorhabditis brenneri]|uniref:F-box domain-containing protein n=1 Tax=Caenorhabditis brenneri TaxID=135651 RepID=G0N613_CAEBE|nr:hypothetical protein CAEBREN_05954 [Caenorhabditis brenneri]
MRIEPKFPLFKLPFLCIECALLKFHVFDLITFSFVSQKCKYAVKLVKKHCWKRINIYKDFNKISIKFLQDGDAWSCGWFFSLNGHRELFTRDIGFLSVNSDWINSKTYPFLSEDPQESAIRAIRYLTNCLNRPIYECRIFMDNLPVRYRDSLVPLMIHCEVFLLANDTVLENDEITEILKNLRVRGGLIINTPLNDNFDISQFQSERISFKTIGAASVTRSILFGLQQNEILVLNCIYSKIRAEDFVEFFDRWYNSEDRKFKNLLLKWKDAREPFDMNLLNAYEIHKYDSRRRAPAFGVSHRFRKKCEDGMDIMRKDGLWATILNTRECLYFHVWLEPFEDTTGRKTWLN